MKKFTLFLITMIVGFAASAQYLVYDFKASYEGVAPVYAKVSYNTEGIDLKPDNYVGYFDTFDTDKDSLKGYLVLSACEDCSPDGEYTQWEAENLYVQRKGDNLDNVFALDVDIDAAMFNKGVGTRLAGESYQYEPTSLKKIKKAWMYISFPDLDWETTQAVEFKGLTQPATYGFFGFQSYDGWLEAMGYGKLSVITSKGSSSINFCGNDIQPGTTCVAINSIKGCMGGYAYYTGFCTPYAPMWDVCDLDNIDWAPICGKWAIKLNKKLSAQYVADGEDAILGKFKSVGDVIYLPEDDL